MLHDSASGLECRLEITGVDRHLVCVPPELARVHGQPAIEPRPGLAQMVQQLAKIVLCLEIRRLGPEGFGNGMPLKDGLFGEGDVANQRLQPRAAGGPRRAAAFTERESAQQLQSERSRHEWRDL